MFGSEKVSYRRYTITRSLETMLSMKDERCIRNPDRVGRPCLIVFQCSYVVFRNGKIQGWRNSWQSLGPEWAGPGAVGGACSSPFNCCSPRALTMVTLINESTQSLELAKGGVISKSTILRAMTLFFYVFKK